MGTLRSLHETLTSWYRRARERSELTRLDAWSKRDLGLGDSEIWREAYKHCWRA